MDMFEEIKQISRKKWIAFARAHVEGVDYFFSFDFAIPEDLYRDLWDASDHNIPIEKSPRYEEALVYAQLAIDYRALCGFETELYPKDDEETDADYWQDLIRYNSDQAKVDAELEYIRLFDPAAEERFVDYCLDLPVKEEYVGKRKRFAFYQGIGENYEWTIDYHSIEESVVTRVVPYVKTDNPMKFLSGNNSVYPPYERIIEDIKMGEVFSELEEFKQN